MLNLQCQIGKIYAFCLDILFPQKCILCGEFGGLVCLECAKSIEKIKTLTCPQCGKISEDGRYCKICRSNKKVILKGILVSAHYDSEIVKKMIYGLKYDGLTDLSEMLAELLIEKIEKRFDPQNTVIVPVPLHIKRKNRRGFNQSELLARYVSKKLGFPGGNALVRIKNTKSQAQLPKSERLTNISGAFECEDEELVRKKRVILIDDVVSTGATLNEAANALKMAGAKEVWGVVVARNI